MKDILFWRFSEMGHVTVFEIRENNHCGGVTFQAGNPEPMFKNPPSTVIISSYFEHCV